MHDVQPDHGGDRSLFEALQRGDERAFAAVVEKYTPRLLGHAFRLTQDWQRAEDLVQDVWMTVWRKRERIHPERNFAGWVFTILHNRAIDLLRRKHPGFVPLEPADHGLQSPDPSDPAESASAADEHDVLHKAVELLPAELSTVITLRYLEEMSIWDIAETLGVSESTVKRRERLSRALLQRNIEGLEGA